jgi:NitT/TauT family transport system permease protein
MFPSSEGSMVFITFVGALFPILLNTDPRRRGSSTPRWSRRRAASARGAGGCSPR